MENNISNSVSPQTRIVSAPGATVEIKVIEIPPHIKEAISRGLKLGVEAARPIRGINK